MFFKNNKELENMKEENKIKSYIEYGRITTILLLGFNIIFMSYRENWIFLFMSLFLLLFQYTEYYYYAEIAEISNLEEKYLNDNFLKNEELLKQNLCIMNKELSKTFENFEKDYKTIFYVLNGAKVFSIILTIYVVVTRLYK